MLPDFFGRRVVHLLDGFAGHVITVLVTCKIEYFHRLVFAGPVAILDHQSLYAGSDCNGTKRAKYNINDNFHKCFFLKFKLKKQSVEFVNDNFVSRLEGYLMNNNCIYILFSVFFIFNPPNT